MWAINESPGMVTGLSVEMVADRTDDELEIADRAGGQL
jgi:hypothetical protein